MEEEHCTCHNKSEENKQHKHINKSICDISVDKQGEQGIRDEKPNASKTEYTRR